MNVLINERDYEIICDGEIRTLKSHKMARDAVCIFYPDAEFSRIAKPGCLIFYSPNKHEIIYIKWDSTKDI